MTISGIIKRNHFLYTFCIFPFLGMREAYATLVNVKITY